MKKICLLVLAGSCGLLRAQSNLPLPTTVDQEIGVKSKHFFYDGKARELVYYENVVVTNWQGQMTCERLVISLPPEGSTNNHLNHVVAETNVVIDFLRNGDMNHGTSDRAIYNYGVVGAVTNETITFTGNAKAENSKLWMTGEPLVWDNIAEKFTGTDFKTLFKPAPHSSSATNASGADTNFPPGKLDLVPPAPSGNPQPQFNPPGSPPNLPQH